MRRPTRGLLAPAALALVAGALAPSAGAQASGYVDLDGAYVAPWDASAQHGLALSVAPAVRFDRRRFTLLSEGGVTLADPSHYYLQNTTSASLRTREYRGLILEGGASVGGLAYRSDGFHSVGDERVAIARGLVQVAGRGRADYVLDKWGFSLAASGGENYGGVVHQPWSIEAGLTRELRNVLLFANARADRFRKTDTTTVYGVGLYDVSSMNAAAAADAPFEPVQPLLTVSGGGTISVGRAELTTELGAQRGQPPADPARPRPRRFWNEVFGSIAATYRLAPRTLLRIGAGMYPTDYIRQLPRGGFVSIGLRLERGRRQPVDWYRPPEVPAFRVDSLAGGARVVHVRAPRALKVDVSADFTDWTPVPMRRTRAGEWEAVLPIVPGTYRVSVRVDGGPWSAPPGLVGVTDEFNGEVGLVVIR